MDKNKNEPVEQLCYHCGEPCDTITIVEKEKSFCCRGCLTVFEILSQNDLCDYYALEKMPGISQINKQDSHYEYLDHETIIDQLVDFQDEKLSLIHI